MTRALSPLLALAIVLIVPCRAAAGGLYLTDRGVRALGRGGAFVAGADDGQSLWYNPAGLASTPRKQLLIDGTLTLFRGSFQRTTSDDVNGPPPRVNANPLKLPVPTLAYSDDFGLRDFTFGIALMAPNAVLLRWPQTAGTTADGYPRPGPTRYSLLTMQGSALANLAVGAAWHGIEGLSIGAGLHVVAARFRAGVYLSACDYGVLCQQEEQPDYEAPATIDLQRAITATPIVGITYRRGMVRLGASLMLFYTVQGDAKLHAKLLSAPLFGARDECTSDAERARNPACARIVGDKAHLALDFPLVARAGVEVSPTDRLRVELDLVYEGWSRQRELRVTPRGVHIDNALGLPRYDVGPIVVPRAMNDVYSLRLGGEYALSTLPAVVRAGVSAENSAFGSRTLTPLTLDSKKLLLAVGASFELLSGLWVDLLYAHLFMQDVRVKDSIVVPQNPLRPPQSRDPSDPVGSPEPVGNGQYGMEADLVGAGLRWTL